VSDIWLTADTHFNHRNMIEHGWRAFDTVNDMNDAIITGWNETVRPTDSVWHLGDWAMGSAQEHLPILAQLHGTVHLVAGNHDAPWPGNRDAHKHQRPWLDAGFATIQAFARRKIAGRGVLLSHFPYRGDHRDIDRHHAYRLPDTGLWLLHGHVHTEWTRNRRQLNVGVDVRGFRPVHLDEIAAEINPDTPN
jgi:calcineurin-like phosphoesterase family protein